MTAVEFPILGTEPLPVEFANTLYGSGDTLTDFLRTPEWTSLWFAEATPDPPPVSDARARALRDCVHRLLTAKADAHPLNPATVATLNTFAAAAPTTLALHQDGAGDWSPTWTDTVTGEPALLGRIATCAIELLTGADATNLRRCPAPDCGLLFVKNHSRRRFCHPSCGHRDRQARYYRRHSRDNR
ncbi:CGNR zinc finger domain-containing protein [Actinokineospora sp. 24-640]